jgi:DNA-binding transcriptional regulator YiaG
MTPDALKSARIALGLSAEGFAKLVHVESGRTVRRWEAGERDIPGPVVVIVGALMESRAVRRHFGVALDGDSTLKNG